MCKYYAHTYQCGHTETVFADFCPSAALVQTPCGRGDIWATVKVEANCERCATDPGPVMSRSTTGAPRKSARSSSGASEKSGRTGGTQNEQKK